MDNFIVFREWRAEEIAKLVLLKSEYKLSIDKYPTPLFDYFVTLKEKTEVRFAVEVKLSSNFKKSISKQFSSIRVYEESQMLTTPVLILKIDEKNEKGVIDFLVEPNINEKKLIIKKEFNFIELNQANLDNKVETIIRWYENK
jgi:hypothetical protein